MKKVFAMILALVMVLSMSAVALADDGVIDTAGGSHSGDVYVEVTGTESVGDVYAVNITWESLTFVFTATNWNAVELSYDGSWTTKTREITVKNNSNVAITATNTLNVLQETNGTTASITDGASFDLEIGGSDTITITASGNPTVEDSTFKIGSVKISIAKKFA